MRTIELNIYNKEWASEYKSEVHKIRNIIRDIFVASYHIGSTAIVGIKSKPTIDILIEVSDIREVDNYKDKFASLGYVSEGSKGIKGRHFFYKGEDFRSHHVHIYQAGDPEVGRHVDFVEYLNAHPDIARKYERLKIELANKFKESPKDYSEGKSKFIDSVEKEAAEWKGSVQNSVSFH